MKKIILALTIAFTLSIGLQAQTYINTVDGTSFNFKAPSGLTTDYIGLFPAAESQVKTPAATIPVTVKQYYTFVTLSDTLVGATTINATINSQLTKGAIIVISAKSGTTARTITWGTGFTSTTTAGVISKTKAASFIYNGSTFIPLGVPIQID